MLSLMDKKSSFLEEFYINATLHKTAFLTTLQQFPESRCYGCRVRGNYVQQQLLLFTHWAFFLQDLVHNNIEVLKMKFMTS